MMGKMIILFVKNGGGISNVQYTHTCKTCINRLFLMTTQWENDCK
jgi:hypothetical protein